MMLRKVLVWAAGALIVGAVAFATGNATLMGDYYQNATNGAKVDNLGNATVVEQYPASSFSIFKPYWMNTVLMHRLFGSAPPSPYVMQDSTSAEDVRGANGLALMLYPTFKDSCTAVVLAIQVRWHFTNGAVDSSTSFIEQPVWNNRISSLTTAPAATVRDSIGSLVYGGSAYGAQADSLASPDEQVVVLTNVNPGGQNRGRLIRITPPNAPAGYSAGPFMSVRIRHLNTIQAGNVFAGELREQFVRLNVALVGWR